MTTPTPAAPLPPTLRDVYRDVMVIAAELAQRKPLISLWALEDNTHIGHRQFKTAYDGADEACRMLAIRLRSALDKLAPLLAVPQTQDSVDSVEARALFAELKAILVRAHPEDSAYEPAISHLCGKIERAHGIPSQTESGDKK